MRRLRVCDNHEGLEHVCNGFVPMSAAPIICWFRKDLRVTDHPSLAAAAKSGQPVIPLYILPDGAGSDADWPMGGASRWWLHHSLASLAVQLEKLGSRLLLRRGDPLEIIPKLAAEANAKQVQWTRAYEPWDRALDAQLKELLTDGSVACKRFAGRLIFEPEEIQTGSGTPYKVFTPFWRACQAAMPSAKPLKAPGSMLGPSRWPGSDALASWNLLPKTPDWSGGFDAMWTPGEKGAQAKLRSFLSGPVSTYANDRDRPDRSGTSELSPHLHFGEISPRQVWAATQHAMARSGEDDGGQKFLAEIGWREFSHHLLYHWPTLPTDPFRSEFGAFPWDENASHLRAWQTGQTGYPIVDAGMRQLWQNGWMHNRIRMVVASFLIKHLLVPWQDGEAWFWDTLVDADLASNAAGWQWVAGSGADASPYFRIFNPMSQGKKFDPNGDYVRKYVPELAELPANVIHEPWVADPMTLHAAGVKLGETYPEPIVDHAQARQKALDGYKVVKEANSS